MDWLDTFTASSSWTNRYGTNAANYKNAILFAAYDSADAEKAIGDVKVSVELVVARMADVMQALDTLNRDPADMTNPEDHPLIRAVRYVNNNPTA